jgi:hypothetical protein
MIGRTTIVIAHRLSTVKRAHQILVMEKGRITARGTHDELLRSSPLYQHLNEIQFQLQAEHELVPAGVAPAAEGATSGAGRWDGRRNGSGRGDRGNRGDGGGPGGAGRPPDGGDGVAAGAAPAAQTTSAVPEGNGHLAGSAPAREVRR